MRIPVALMAVFMVSGAVAQLDRIRRTWISTAMTFSSPMPTLSANSEAQGFGADLRVQRPQDRQGCERRVQGATEQAQMMPKEIPFTDLANVCSLRSDNRF